MECKKLNMFVCGKEDSCFKELGHVFSCGGYDIACDGYRLAAIRTGAETPEDATGKQKLIYATLKRSMEDLETDQKFRFSRDLKNEIEKKYKEIRVASETTVYKRDLVLGLNYTTGEFVLYYKFEKRDKAEVADYQYFNYKYFSDLLEFFPRFSNIDINYKSSKFSEIFVHLGTRYSLLLPIAIRNIK